MHQTDLQSWLHTDSIAREASDAPPCRLLNWLGREMSLPQISTPLDAWGSPSPTPLENFLPAPLSKPMYTVTHQPSKGNNRSQNTGVLTSFSTNCHV